MKFLHFADLHFDAPNREAALKSLTEIHRVGCERKVGFWVCAGDLFNRGVANTEASGFPRLVSIIQEMLDVAPIVAVEGTRTSHDLPGCYAVLTQLKARNDFLLLDPGETVILGWEDEKVLVMGCPEPTREWIVAQNGERPLRSCRRSSLALCARSSSASGRSERSTLRCPRS